MRRRESIIISNDNDSDFEWDAECKDAIEKIVDELHISISEATLYFMKLGALLIRNKEKQIKETREIDKRKHLRVVE